MVGGWSQCDYSVCPCPLLQFFQFMSDRLHQVTQVTSSYVSLRLRDGTWSSTTEIRQGQERYKSIKRHEPDRHKTGSRQDQDRNTRLPLFNSYPFEWKSYFFHTTFLAKIIPFSYQILKILWRKSYHEMKTQQPILRTKKMKLECWSKAFILIEKYIFST